MQIHFKIRTRLLPALCHNGINSVTMKKAGEKMARVAIAAPEAGKLYPRKVAVIMIGPASLGHGNPVQELFVLTH